MQDLRKAISALSNAEKSLESARDAITALPATFAGKGKELAVCIQNARNGVLCARRECEEKLTEIEGEVFGEGTLQLTFDAGKKPVRIIVNRPNNGCSSPHLTAIQWIALQSILGMPPPSKIRVRAKYNVAVLGQFGNVELTIPPSDMI